MTSLSARPSSRQIKDTVTMDAGRATKEAEILRKQCKALCQELKEALQEADVAKCRRDWAFQERDKIVAERDSIRYGAPGWRGRRAPLTHWVCGEGQHYLPRVQVRWEGPRCFFSLCDAPPHLRALEISSMSLHPISLHP